MEARAQLAEFGADLLVALAVTAVADDDAGGHERLGLAFGHSCDREPRDVDGQEPDEFEAPADLAPVAREGTAPQRPKVSVGEVGAKGAGDPDPVLVIARGDVSRPEPGPLVVVLGLTG